jgi:hypothetical protein
MASKNKELDYCVLHWPDLLNKLRTLHEQLSSVFPPDKTASEKEKGDAARLRDGLTKATAAIEAFDNDAAIEALDGLQAYDFGEKANSLLAGTVAALKLYDFDGAKDILSKI